MSCFFMLTLLGVPHTTFAEKPFLDYEKTELDNGAKLICGYIPESSLVAVQVRVLSGLSNEGEYAGTGISHFLEHLLFKGTDKYNSEDLRKKIKHMGGVVNGATGLDSAYYYMMVPNDQLETALRLLLDMVTQLVFTDEEMEMEREVILKEIRLKEDDPADKRISLLFSEVYKTHVYGYPIIGWEERLKKLTREDLMSYHSLAYGAGGMVVGVVGGVPLEESVPMSAAILREYTGGRKNVTDIPREPSQKEVREAEFGADITLGYLAMGFNTTSLYSEDLYPVDVLSVLLGNGKDSRLYKSLVEDKELLYDVSSFNYTPKYPGVFIITGIGEPEKIKEARDEIFKIIDDLKYNGVLENELQRAKNLVVSEYLHSNEKIIDIDSAMTNSEMLMNDPLFFRKYVNKIQEVKKDDVESMLPKYFSEKKSTTVFLMPNEQRDIIKTELKLKGDPDEKNEKTKDKKKKDERRTSKIAKGITEGVERIKEFFKSDPGKISEERTVRLEGAPPAEEKAVTLKNGLKIIFRKQARLPLVSITFAAKGGLRAENIENNGISNLTAALLLKGTSSRSGEEIVSEIEEYGGMINTFSGMNSIGVTLDLLSEQAGMGIDIIEDILKNSIFPEEEIIKLKKKIIAGIDESDKDIFENGTNHLRKLLYGNDPYGMKISGRVDTVGRVSREEILSFYRERIVPAGSVITVCGDIDIENELKDLEKRFSGWKGSSMIMEGKDSLPIEKKRMFETKMSKQQALLLAGFRGVTIRDSRKYPLSVISALLSGSDGLLFFTAREKQGIAYTSGAVNVPAVDPGFFAIYIATTEENLNEAGEAVDEVIGMVREGKIDEYDIESSKNRLVTQNALSVETNSSISLRMALDELYGLGYDDYLSYPSKIKKVSGEDIVSVAKDMLDPDKSAVVVVHSDGTEY